MTFSYECQKCKKHFDTEFPEGKAPRGMKWPSCGGDGKRIYSGMSIMLKVNGVHGGINRASTFGEQMKSGNTQAGKRMRVNRTPPKLVGYNYGGGKVVEA
jgi:predicted nucleic acid-binding Zn ribbon protein